MKSSPSITTGIIDFCVNSLTSEECDMTKKELLIQVLIFLIRRKDLMPTFRVISISKKLQEAACKIESHTCKGPLDALGGTFCISVQVLIGSKIIE